MPASKQQLENLKRGRAKLAEKRRLAKMKKMPKMKDNNIEENDKSNINCKCCTCKK